MSATADASSLTRHRSFVRFWCARTFTNGAFMMQGVAVGWQIYALTNDPLDLGLVGLVQFFPLLATSIIAGQVLDLFDRRRGRQRLPGGQGVRGARACRGLRPGLADRESMFAILFVSGTARAFEISDHARDLARCRADGAAAARDRGLGFCAADRGDLRAVARRTAVRARAGNGLRHLHRHLHRRERADQFRRDGPAERAAQSGQPGNGVRRLRLYPQPSDCPRRHLARSVRRPARRRHGAAADLRA